jgi:2-haloacid dehalogenase
MSGYDAVIFDFGRVLTAFEPDRIATTLLGDPVRGLRVRRAIFAGPTWTALDRGLLSESEAAARIIDAHPDEAAGIRRFFARYKDFLETLPAGLAMVEGARAAGMRIYGLSNMSREAWEIVGRRRAFLALFDGVMISSLEGITKPDPAIYQRLLSRYAIDPERAVFVDDAPSNVEAARRLRIDGVHFQDHRRLAAALERRGILTRGSREEALPPPASRLQTGRHQPVSRP